MINPLVRPLFLIAVAALSATACAVSEDPSSEAGPVDDTQLDQDEAGVAQACPPVTPPRCLVTVYSGENFQGAQACLDHEGFFDAGALEAKGLPRNTMASIKVARGYYARLRYVPDPASNWDAVIRGNDARLADDPNPNGRPFINVTVTKRTVCQGRPRVFMAMHGANALSPATHDGQWSYVRDHLDGIYENNAGIEPADVAAIYRKIKTRNMIAIQNELKETSLIPLAKFNRLEEDFGINRVHEAMSLYKRSADMWNADDITLFRRAYVEDTSFPAASRFQKVFAGFSVHEFTPAPDAPDVAPIDRVAGQRVVSDADGAFAECAMDNCGQGMFQDAFYDLIDRMHANGRPFMWFNGTKSNKPAITWYKGTQRMYFKLEADGKIGPNDIIMIINYGGALPPVPETDAQHPDGAPTATGAMYWLLHQ